MRRHALVLLVALPLCACERTVETFDFTLHLNLAGDELLLADLDTLSVEIDVPDGSTVTQQWDPFDASDQLEVPEVPRGEDIVIRIAGVVAQGTAQEQVASGATAPLILPDQDEAWVLFHRHPALVKLEGGADEREPEAPVGAVELTAGWVGPNLGIYNNISCMSEGYVVVFCVY